MYTRKKLRDTRNQPKEKSRVLKTQGEIFFVNTADEIIFVLWKLYGLLNCLKIICLLMLPSRYKI